MLNAGWPSSAFREFRCEATICTAKTWAYDPDLYRKTHNLSMIAWRGRFFYKKIRVSEQELGKKCIWTAIDTPTRLIVSFLIGDRTFEDVRRFLKDLVSRTRQKPLFTSDELFHYADALKELSHKTREKGRISWQRSTFARPQFKYGKSLY